MTTAIIAVETALVVLLIVLVAGLLRSHAEILRRIGPGEQGVAPPPRPRAGSRGVAAPALTGATPAGDAVSLAFDDRAPSTLLAFLTTGCSTCAGFWESLGERHLPDVQTVIVTHGAERELPAKLRKLAPEGVPVVMSSSAWEDFEVPGAPYFVLVDGTIRGEGTASTWQGLTSLVRDATDGQHQQQGRPSLDEVFASAGIGEDHPSLRPGRT